MTNDKKVKATADIYYEAMMLHRAFSEYWQSEPQAPGTWQHNAFLEATLLHTRSTLDFFEGSRTGSRRAHPDDVIAADYAFSSAPFPFTAALRERINKRIAHLTYSRTEVRDEHKRWDFPSFLRPILDRYREFFSHLLSSGHAMSDWPGDTAIRTFITELQ